MTNKNTSQFVIYQSEDGQIKLDVRFVDETVWLTQQQVAELFQASRTNVVEHIQHIDEEGELEAAATCRDFRQIRTEGARSIAFFQTVQNKMHWAFAEAGYEQFNVDRIAHVDRLDSDFDRAVKQLPATPGKLKKQDT